MAACSLALLSKSVNCITDGWTYLATAICYVAAKILDLRVMCYVTLLQHSFSENGYRAQAWRSSRSLPSICRRLTWLPLLQSYSWSRRQARRVAAGSLHGRETGFDAEDPTHSVRAFRSNRQIDDAHLCVAQPECCCHRTGVCPA